MQGFWILVFGLFSFWGEDFGYLQISDAWDAGQDLRQSLCPDQHPPI
jgi:hypothetical protein